MRIDNQCRNWRIFFFVCVCLCCMAMASCREYCLVFCLAGPQFFQQRPVLHDPPECKPPFNLESVKLFKSLCDMLMRDSGVWSQCTVRTSFSAACRHCYPSRANWIASWFKSGQNLPLLAVRGNIKKLFHCHSVDILWQA